MEYLRIREERKYLDKIARLLEEPKEEKLCLMLEQLKESSCRKILYVEFT